MDTFIVIIITFIIMFILGRCLKIASKKEMSPNEQMPRDDQVINHENESQEFRTATDYQPNQSENSYDDELSYDWETDEVLQMAKAYRISSDEESSDGNTSDEFLVPEPSISGIMEGTSYTSSSKATTDIEENYIVDDLSSLTNISDIEVSNAPQKHEYAKARVEREGNTYDRLYNACLKGQVSIVKDILEMHNGTLAPDEHGQTPLYAACLGNHFDIITLLISFGYDVNHQDNEGKTPLHKAFENHDPDFAQTLISQFCGNTEVRDTQNWTPLHTAIDQGYFNYSDDLKCKFFHQDIGTEVTWVQLQAACFKGRTQDAQVLLDSNADVNHVSSAGYTSLHIAVTKNNTDLVTLLIDQNADVNSMTSRRQTPLHIAAENHNDSVIQKLLKMKANVNLKDELGNTSLHLSVQLNQEVKPKKAGARADTSTINFQKCSVQTIEAFIDHGAAVNAENNKCQTALWLACCDGQDTLVKILLDAGADPNITDKYGDLSLHSAICGYCSKDTLHELIDHGAHVNAANNNGETAILLAACGAQGETVRLLLIARADPNIANADGDTCLHGAVYADCSEEILQDLIVYGSDVNAVNKSGRTPLLLSCFFRQMDSVNVLLGAGADPTISDEQDFSCLHAAVDGRCSKDTLQALIDHGAHIDATRKDGTTALLAACRTGQSTSVMFLLDSGADVKLGKPDGNTCLHLAVNGHCSKETTRKIIEQGLNVNASNSKGETALIVACRNAQMESVKVLLEHGANPNISDASGCSSLLAAIHGNCTNETLKEIIACKVDLDAQDKNGRTALLLACIYRQQEAVQVLLEARSNTNIADNKGNSSLSAAAHSFCRKRIIQAIIDHGANVNAINKEKCTALMRACKQGHSVAIHVLLKAGSDTNIADNFGDTCLMHAVARGCSKKVLQEIIDHDANMNATNDENNTALMVACRQRHTDAIHGLLKAKSDTNIADEDGGTCLMRAVALNFSKEVLQAIIDHGADVNAQNIYSHTALALACRKRHVDGIHVLLKAGADTNIVDNNGTTCLTYAVHGDCSMEVLQAITDHGANANATDKDNGTALMWACLKSHVDAIHVLLKVESDTNIADKNGNTCLMHAVGGYCTKEVLQAIIDHGADVNVTNKHTLTALMTACKRRHVDAIYVLLKAGADTNIVHKNGDTCLMYAVCGNFSKAVLQEMIDHGADVNATNKENLSALMLACGQRHIDAIHVLLKAESDTNIADKDGFTCLMHAVAGDCSKEVLQAIIDHGTDVNATNEDNRPALMLACFKRHVDAIHVLLKEGSDTNIVNKTGDTCLMYAVDRDCSKEVLQAIIDHDADINATNKETRNALMMACGMKRVDAIHVLLKAESDTNAVDKYGNTWLMHAVYGDCSKEALQAIIDHGADVNTINKFNRTALMTAYMMRHVDSIHVLLKAGADTNSVDKNGNTCLMHAVRGDCTKQLLQEIIDLGADVNATNKNSRTALMTACERRHVDAIYALLKTGSDTNIVDEDGVTCLMYAVYGDCSKEVLQALIDHGSDVNATNKDNSNALMVANVKKHVDAIYVLLKAKSDTNAVDKNGDTCLMHAVCGDCSKEVLQAIIDNGADVNATNKYNRIALMMACGMRHVDAIHVLLKAESDTNIADENGVTSLMHAIAKYCSKEVLQALIDHGADVNATDKSNFTALMLACEKRHADAIHVLLKAGSDTNIVDKNGDTCLMHAVAGEWNKEVLKEITNRGNDVNATNKGNRTALIWACRKSYVDAFHVLQRAESDTNIAEKNSAICRMYAVAGDCNQEVLQALIDHGADVNATNKNNRTALMIACFKRYVDSITILLKAGSDTNIEDKDGDTCLMHAVAGDFSKEVLQAMIDHGADVNATNKDIKTALMWACEMRHVDAIHVLLKAESDTNIVDKNGATCLMYAVVLDCSIEVLQAMIDHGADVNATNEDNRPALMLACGMRHVGAIHVLLKAGADTNILDKNGDTCLMYAVDRDCSKEVLQALIDHDADLNATNKKNHSALMIACFMRHVDGIHVLLKAESDTNAVDKNGDTCLMHAVYGDCSNEVLQAIIDHGADLNATDKDN